MLKEKIELLIKNNYPNVIIGDLYNSDKTITDLFSFDSISFVKFIIEIEEVIGIQFTSPDIFDMNITYAKFLSVIEHQVKNEL